MKINKDELIFNDEVKLVYKWFPEDFEKLIEKPPYYNNSKPRLELIGKEKDVLSGFGKCGGAQLIAECFLNFGHKKSSHINYDYLKEYWSNDILDEESCEVRIQKIDTIKHII